jgi:hypothetical protein
MKKMDLEINVDILKVGEILKALGFKDIYMEDDVIEAKLKDGFGRIHVLGAKVNDNTVYLDVHRDSLIHFIFIGVDYSKKPREICEKILDYATKIGISGRIIGGTNWFNRKNQAVFRGIRF